MDKNKIDSADKIYHLILMIPLIVLAAVIPLIVHQKILPVDQNILDFWKNDRQNSDYFSYYKSISIIVAAMFALTVFIVALATKRLTVKRSCVYIFIALFASCIILSTAFSDYRHTAVYGFPDRYEGAIVLLAYLVVLFIAMNVVNEEIQIKLILGSLLASSVILGIIGLLQVFGVDLFDTALGKSIILTPQFRDIAGSIKASTDQGSAVSTLYNSNTLGLYMSMTFPLTVSLFLLEKKRCFRIMTGAVACLMFANLIGSNSRASYVSMIITTIIIIVMIRKQLVTSWRSIVCVISCFIFIFIGLNCLSNGYISSRMISALTSQDMHVEDRAVDKIKDFKIDVGCLTLYCTNSQLKLAVKDIRMKFYDEDNNELEWNSSGQDGYGSRITLLDSRYNGFILMVSENLIKVQKGKSSLYFAVLNDNFYFLNSRGELIDDFTVEKFGFEGLERLASGRGYIWSRTLPLLSHTLFRGYGPDTFAMYFPQNDYMGKLNFMYDANLIIDKPHNMYLQTSVNTGVLSLIAFLGILAYYIFSSIALYKNSTLESFYSKAGFAIFISIIGYMITGLFTDSTVSVSPVFWILLGVGMGINRQEKLTKYHNVA